MAAATLAAALDSQSLRAANHIPAVTTGKDVVDPLRADLTAHPARAGWLLGLVVGLEVSPPVVRPKKAMAYAAMPPDGGLWPGAGAGRD